MIRSLVLYTLAQAALVVAIAYVLTRWVWTGDGEVQAVRASAWLAIGVQIVTFAIARLVARENVIAGWGIGMLLRFASVAVWAFLGVRAMNLPVGPALLSLVLFYFVSTLIEPLFLNAQTPGRMA